MKNAQKTKANIFSNHKILLSNFINPYTVPDSLTCGVIPILEIELYNYFSILILVPIKAIETVESIAPDPRIAAKAGSRPSHAAVKAKIAK